MSPSVKGPISRKNIRKQTLCEHVETTYCLEHTPVSLDERVLALVWQKQQQTKLSYVSNNQPGELSLTSLRTLCTASGFSEFKWVLLDPILTLLWPKGPFKDQTIEKMLSLVIIVVHLGVYKFDANYLLMSGPFLISLSCNAQRNCGPFWTP